VELRLSRCLVRDWRPRDAASIVPHANNRKVWLNLRDAFPHPYTLADARRWIRAARSAKPRTNFAIVVGGSAAGGIGLRLREDVHSRSAEIGFWLGEDHWGRGIATEAVRAVTNHAFRAFDLCRIDAQVFAWNPASMRVLEKAGYAREGRLRRSVTKDGRTIDSLMYAITRGLPAGK
jgi:RimJ/RimL family protein N-acetyltransferase